MKLVRFPFACTTSDLYSFQSHLFPRWTYKSEILNVQFDASETSQTSVVDGKVWLSTTAIPVKGIGNPNGGCCGTWWPIAQWHCHCRAAGLRPESTTKPTTKHNKHIPLWLILKMDWEIRKQIKRMLKRLTCRLAVRSVLLLLWCC